MKAIDLFCGAGGLTVGLKKAGFNVVGAIEMNMLANETYRMNHPEVDCILSDISKIKPEDWMQSLGVQPGEIDLIAGCPPCQGFSSLRTRKKSGSVDDVRNDLIFEYFRFVKVFMPKALMLENVPALMRDERMTELLRQLGLLGYDVYEGCVKIEDASWFGVPQRRRRMIMQVMRNGRISAPKKSHKISVRECFERAQLEVSGQSGDRLHDYQPKRSQRIIELIQAIPKDGGSRSALPEHLVLACHKKLSTGFNDVYGRMKLDDVAPTITGGCISPSKGRFLHPIEDRAITLREAALLQTFPQDYQFSPKAGLTEIALMIGNALPPEFIKHHAIQIMTSLSKH